MSLSVRNNPLNVVGLFKMESPAHLPSSRPGKRPVVSARVAKYQQRHGLTPLPRQRIKCDLRCLGRQVAAALLLLAGLATPIAATAAFHVELFDKMAQHVIYTIGPDDFSVIRRYEVQGRVIEARLTRSTIPGVRRVLETQDVGSREEYFRSLTFNGEGR